MLTVAVKGAAGCGLEVPACCHFSRIRHACKCYLESELKHESCKLLSVSLPRIQYGILQSWYDFKTETEAVTAQLGAPNA